MYDMKALLMAAVQDGSERIEVSKMIAGIDPHHPSKVLVGRFSIGHEDRFTIDERSVDGCGYCAVSEVYYSDIIRMDIEVLLNLLVEIRILVRRDGSSPRTIG